MNKAKLKALAALLETIPDEKFNMSIGVQCGTVGCAAGHWFLAHAPEDFKVRAKQYGQESPNHEWSWMLIEDWVEHDLGLYFQQTHRLFRADSYPKNKITRQMVIKRIQEMIK